LSPASRGWCGAVFTLKRRDMRVRVEDGAANVTILAQLM